MISLNQRIRYLILKLQRKAVDLANHSNYIMKQLSHLNSKTRSYLKFILCRLIIYNRNAEIGPKATKDFKLTFRSNLSGKQSALIVAYPILSNTQSTSNTIKLTEIALKIDALGIKPHITVDKSVKNYLT